jgi:hypothetical protein
MREEGEKARGTRDMALGNRHEAQGMTGGAQGIWHVGASAVENFDIIF